jgi:hypothetical protein
MILTESMILTDLALRKHERTNAPTYAITDFTILSNKVNTRDYLAETSNRPF